MKLNPRKSVVVSRKWVPGVDLLPSTLLTDFTQEPYQALERLPSVSIVPASR